MNITKEEVEKLIGDKILTYKVTKSYRGYKVTKVKVVAVKAKDSKEITITLKPNTQVPLLLYILFISMIRTVKHKSGEFIIVNTSFEVKENGRVINVPMSVQVDTSRLSVEEQSTVYKSINGLFNRTVVLNLNKPKNEKSWWKKLFN